MMYRPDDFSWLDYVRTYRTTARCLENQPIYPLDVHEGMLDDWLAGPPDPEPPGPDDFTRMVAAETARGKSLERIRILEAPVPSRYQRWLVWASDANRDAGEIHRYLDRPDADALGLSDARDWWLFDSTVLVEFHYSYSPTRDLRVELVEDPKRVRQAVEAWELASTHARQAPNLPGEIPIA